MICFPKAVLVLDILTSFTFNDGALPSNTVTSNVKFVIESFFFSDKFVSKSIFVFV